MLDSQERKNRSITIQLQGGLMAVDTSWIKVGVEVHRQGKPYAVGTIVRVEYKNGRPSSCTVAGVPENAKPWQDVWPAEECVRIK